MDEVHGSHDYLWNHSPKLEGRSQSYIPTQWIDTDKNEHIKREGKKHTPLYKGRLVASGDRTVLFRDPVNSPTAEVEALNLLLARCASNLFWICGVGVAIAYW